MEIYQKKIEYRKDDAYVEPLTGVKNIQKGGIAYIGDVAKAHTIIKRIFKDREVSL